MRASQSTEFRSWLGQKCPRSKCLGQNCPALILWDNFVPRETAWSFYWSWYTCHKTWCIQSTVWIYAMSARRNVRACCTNTHLQQIVKNWSTPSTSLDQTSTTSSLSPLSSCLSLLCHFTFKYKTTVLLLLQPSFVCLHLNRSGKKRIRQKKGRSRNIDRNRNIDPARSQSNQKPQRQPISSCWEAFF
jgi:hypothetical protein